MTTLHSGGKFSAKAYETSGGLHGVGVSVVNALSADTVVEVAQNKELFRQSFSRGHPTTGLQKLGALPTRSRPCVSITTEQENLVPHVTYWPSGLPRQKAKLQV